MKYKQGNYPILKKNTLAKEIYEFTILCPKVAGAANCGQFVHLLPKGFMLRRPISICGIDKGKGTLRVVFEVRGEGTRELAKLNEGDNIDMLAPLGRGFKILDEVEKVIIIGGGIGTPPMLPLAQIYGEKSTVITGFRSANATILQEDFKATGAKTILCTDDGTMGHHGLVTEPLIEELKEVKPTVIYACGPMPMLKSIAKIAEENGILCQVSMEERMGCGIGACLVCACKTIRNKEEFYAHVCQDGPVFNAKEVIW